MMAHHNTLADSDVVIVAYGRSSIGRAGKGSLIAKSVVAYRESGKLLPDLEAPGATT